MKRLYVLALVIILTVATLPISVGAQADISNTPNNYSFGFFSESQIKETGLSYFTVTNNGTSAVSITISGTDLTGGVTWTLADDATPGADIYGLKAGLEGGSYNVTVNTTGPSILVSSLTANTSQSWGLQLMAPTSFSDGILKSGTVTLTATEL